MGDADGGGGDGGGERYCAAAQARELHVTVSIIGASPVLWFANASPAKGSSAEAFAGRV